MAENQIRFEDGAAYEHMMGSLEPARRRDLSRLARATTRLAMGRYRMRQRRITELLIERCTPAEVQGMDPSERQLALARTRPAARAAEFRQGDAMALPFPDDRFDAAVMALVIFFLPEPAKGVAEMARVVCPGGTVAAYAWDMLGGGYPREPIPAEIARWESHPALPQSGEASRIEVMRDLWTDAGLQAIETREISVLRTFADFDDFWTTTLMAPSICARPRHGPQRCRGAENPVRASLPLDGAG